MSDEDLVKVVFRQMYDDGDDIAIETPWALPLGNDRYQLKNFPFHYYGISYDDIFEAKPALEDNAQLSITRVLEKSGHKTLRVVFEESIEDSEVSRQHLASLSEMGCGYEGNGSTFFVVNVQPHCDFGKVCDYLSSNDLEWEHADPRYKELYPNDED